jgi:hypothetical protein
VRTIPFFKKDDIEVLSLIYANPYKSLPEQSVPRAGRPRKKYKSADKGALKTPIKQSSGGSKKHKVPTKRGRKSAVAHLAQAATKHSSKITGFFKP